MYGQYAYGAATFGSATLILMVYADTRFACRSVVLASGTLVLILTDVRT